MPTSLRLPIDIETQLAGFGSRAGLSKSAVIVRSIQEFLARNSAPSSLQIYQEVMQADKSPQSEAASGALKTGLFGESSGARPAKLAVRQALRNKHAERSQRATNALAAKPADTTKYP